MAERPDPRPPIPLYVGFGLTAVLLWAFACGYFYAGARTASGWYATFAVAFELSGVLLVASPELRPIVEELGRRLAAEVRTWPARLEIFLRRLIGKRVVHVHEMSGTIAAGGSLEGKVIRGFPDAPPPEAESDQQIRYLLEVTEQFKRTLQLVENDLRKGIEAVREDVQRTALDLTKQTADAVEQLARSELRMRLLGVGCIVVGLMLSYAANIA